METIKHGFLGLFRRFRKQEHTCWCFVCNEPFSAEFRTLARIDRDRHERTHKGEKK